MIRILLVDDQNIIRQGLQALLEPKPDLQVVGTAEDGMSALEKVKKLQPDLVLIDIEMPGMNGVTATQKICQLFPTTKVIVLTSHEDAKYLAQALQAGAKGYLLKQTPIHELVIAIRAVYQGYTHMGPGLFEKTLGSSQTPEASPVSSEITLPSKLRSLSPREQEVLQWIVAGLNNREIGAKLFISERTVRNHVTSILSQLQLRDRTQAALYASQFWPQSIS